MTETVKLYNPANAALLTPEQVAGLQTLSIDQLKELAKAYPNGAINKAYLLIIDKTKPIDRQLPNLSTFENLYNLIVRNSQKQWVAYAFKDNARPVNIKVPNPAKRNEVLDLSDTELLNLPGLKVNVGKKSGFKSKT